ncbi:MAG TPA: hypothetical protein PLZ15_09200 [Melioribacteraceae bacterium]|nr:hypothetical protein [Melioribacteraceae bacterium]
MAKELELIDQLYLDFRAMAFGTDSTIQQINKLKTPSLSLELQIRIKRVQIELLTTLELLSELQNCSDETEFEKVLENFVEKG